VFVCRLNPRFASSRISRICFDADAKELLTQNVHIQYALFDSIACIPQ